MASHTDGSVATDPRPFQRDRRSRRPPERFEPELHSSSSRSSRMHTKGDETETTGRTGREKKAAAAGTSRKRSRGADAGSSTIRFAFAKPFRRATRAERLAAAGSERCGVGGRRADRPTSSIRPRDLADARFASHFPELPDPVDQDDWLHQFVEERQSYAQWTETAPTAATRRNAIGSGDAPPIVIYLCEVGDFAERSGFRLAEMTEFVEIFYPGLVVKLHPFNVAIEHSAAAGGATEAVFRRISRHGVACKSTRSRILSRRCHEYDEQCKWATPDHRQLAVTPLMRVVGRTKPRDAFAIVGATMEDLYWDETDSFTMGSAGQGGAGLFSFLRYDPSFELHRKQTARDRAQMFAHSCRTMVHEIGHLLGLEHCTFGACLMQGSGSLREDARIPDFFCPVCLAKLHHVCDHCELLDRYRALREFYKRHKGFARAYSWVDALLRRLECDDGRDGSANAAGG